VRHGRQQILHLRRVTHALTELLPEHGLDHLLGVIKAIS
jgi:hypothetical protein